MDSKNKHSTELKADKENKNPGSFEDASKELLEDLRDGSQEAFKQIYTMYYNGINEFLYHLTRSRADAEDLTQNIFVSIWERREGLDPAKSMRGYLYRSAKYTAMEYFRKLKIQSNYLDAPSSVSEEEFSSEEAFIAHETAILIDLALARMPKMRRKVFEMSKYEGFSNEQISKKLKIPANLVANHLYYAKKDLRELLALFLILFVSR